MILTIGGQYGSGGNEIGIIIAEKLGYRLLDSQLVCRAREIFKDEYNGLIPSWWPSRSGQPFFEEDDIPLPGIAYDQTRFRLQSDLVDSTSQYEKLDSTADPVRSAMLDAQTRAIEEYAKDGNCVIFGRCSNYILKDHPDALHIFLAGDLDLRINRICNYYNKTIDKVTGAHWMPSAYTMKKPGSQININRTEALSLINTTDMRRAACYEFITGEKWGDEKDFDMYIKVVANTMVVYVDMILAEMEKRQTK